MLNQSPGKNMYKIVIKYKPKGQIREKGKLIKMNFRRLNQCSIEKNKGLFHQHPTQNFSSVVQAQ